MSGDFGTRLEDLGWIDAFAASVRPYVRVRLEDNLLIKMPVEAHSLNGTAARLLHAVLGGRGIRRVALDAGAGEHPERIVQIHALFCDVRDLLSGAMGEGQRRRATEVGPFTGSFSRYPVLSELALTYRCNQSCRFCYAGCGAGDAGLAGAAGAGEISTREAKRLIDVIARDARAPSISFTGGEPTLRGDLAGLVAHAHGRGMRTNLITNGTGCASGDLARRLAGAGLDSAQVSVEGADAGVHDGLTRRAGSFDEAVAAVRNLRDAGVRTHTNTTLSAANADLAESVVDMAADLGLERVSMNLTIPTTPPGGAGGVHLRYRDAGRFILRARDRAERRRIHFHWYSPLPFCVFNPVAHGLGNKGCAACDGLLHVSPTGDVLPCSSFPAGEGVGNLLRESFDSVWFGARARHYKEKRMAPAGCVDCEHFALCQGACVLYWRQMGLGELGGERRVPACA